MSARIIAGVILSVASLIIMWVLLLKKNEPFFNLREIMKNHLKLFSNCKSQYFVFYILPLLLSIGLALLFSVNISFYTHMGVVLSIILSMMMALLSILSNYSPKEIKNSEQSDRAIEAVKQTINATLFSCFIGVALLLLGFIAIAGSGMEIKWIPFDLIICKRILSIITYYFLFVELLNLLLIIKNMHRIIEFNLESKRNKE